MAFFLETFENNAFEKRKENSEKKETHMALREIKTRIVVVAESVKIKQKKTKGSRKKKSVKKKDFLDYSQG